MWKTILVLFLVLMAYTTIVHFLNKKSPKTTKETFEANADIKQHVNHLILTAKDFTDTLDKLKKIVAEAPAESITAVKPKATKPIKLTFEEEETEPYKNAEDGKKKAAAALVDEDDEEEDTSKSNSKMDDENEDMPESVKEPFTNKPGKRVLKKIKPAVKETFLSGVTNGYTNGYLLLN